MSKKNIAKKDDMLGLELEKFKTPIDLLSMVAKSVSKDCEKRKEAKKLLKKFWGYMIKLNKSLTQKERKQIREALYLFVDKS